jgi:hypothetical protein
MGITVMGITDISNLVIDITGIFIMVLYLIIDFCDIYRFIIGLVIILYIYVLRAYNWIGNNLIYISYISLL